MRCAWWLLVAAVLGLSLVGVFVESVRGDTYYVDYEGGSDASAGTGPEAAFKHCPGDSAATDAAKAVKLAAGDTVIFKGGVRYLGSVQCRASGAEGKPITFDGNTAGTFGEGKAIIDGAVAVTGWKPCASAEEAKGNPLWRKIFYADVPKPYRWNLLNLCDEEKSLPIAQDPNPSDTIFQEDPNDYHAAEGVMKRICRGKIYAEKGTGLNSSRPLIYAITPQRGSGVVSPLAGAAVSVEPPEPVTVTAVGLRIQPNYTPVREVAFYGDGKELLKATMKETSRETQKFDLPKPTTLKKLTVKFLSAFGTPKHNWTAIAQVAAYDASGKNVLEFPVRMAFDDAKVFTQADPDYYKGMMFAFHGGPNAVIYLPIEQYVPSEHRIYLSFYGGKQYKRTRYCLLNSVRLIDRPGEYSVEATGDEKTHRVYFMPEKLAGGLPTGISLSRYAMGFSLQGASHVVVQGFRIRRQSNFRAVAGVSARGPAEDVVIRDCDVSLLRSGTGITTYQVNRVLVERCSVCNCSGHSKGIVLRNGTDVTTKDCRLVRNTSTAIDYYTCTDGKVIGCTVLDHRGMHANGLTFYLGCKNTVVERNYVARGNCALTFQSAENILVRNNVFDGSHRTMVIGIWPGQPLKNVRILNNCMVRSSREHAWAAGLFTNSRKIEGLVVMNNIIDGLASDHPFAADAVFSHNLYTKLGPNLKDKPLGPGELLETDLEKIFVAPAEGDFRLRAGSPAIDAGAKVDVSEDYRGAPRPQGKAIDVGPYEFTEK